jgi:hypothetical protein
MNAATDRNQTSHTVGSEEARSIALTPAEIEAFAGVFYSCSLRPSRRSAQISSRKQRKQARSAGLVAAVLEAAVQVSAKKGAQRFTTAEKAGVSVGALSVFSDKTAILFWL